MNPRIVHILMAVALVAMAAPADAQIGPVRLKVTRVNKEARVLASRTADGAREEQLVDRVYYKGELTNTSSAPVRNVVVKWAILVRPHSTTNLSVVEGEYTCSLALGERSGFDTDIIELTGTRTRSTETGSRSDTKSRIVGYAVEVYVGDRRMAWEADPQDTMRRIEDMKQAQEPPPPGTHRF